MVSTCQDNMMGQQPFTQELNYGKVYTYSNITQEKSQLTIRRQINTRFDYTTDLVNIKVINDGIEASVQIVEQRNNLRRKSHFNTLKPPQKRIAKAVGI